MRDRGKGEVEEYNNNNYGDYYLGDENFPQFPCKKHPTSSYSSGGICAYCLTDRLAQLVCPECGEQKLSSFCSCSQIFNNNNSSTSEDVGRISFLLENEKISSSNPRIEPKTCYNNDQIAPPRLRRSNSIAVDAMNNNTNVSRSETTGKFWKFGKLFRKKREKKTQINEENYECNNGVSRSRSVSSFRGFYDTEENGGFAVSSSSAARASSVSTGNFVLDSAKISCFSESEARMSNFDYCDASNFIHPNRNNNNNNIFSLRETEFVQSEDHAFIDLKLHDTMSSDQNSSRRVPDLAALKRSGLGLSTKEFGYRGEHEMFRNGGGSCRISSVSDRDRDLRKCKKSYKVWKWFSKHEDNNSGKFHDHTFN